MLKRSAFMLRKASEKSLFLFGIFFVFLVFCFSALTLMASVKETKDEVLYQIGAYVEFLPNHETLEKQPNLILSPHPAALVAQIREIDHVVGMDPFGPQTYVTCLPKGFFNSKRHEGAYYATSDENLLVEDSDVLGDGILLFGLPDILVRDEFRRGFSRVIEGELPTDEHPGLLVNSVLASENSMAIGDHLTLQSIEAREQIESAPIVGIYETKLRFEIMQGNVFGAGVFMHSPFNRIYTNYDFVSEMAGQPATLGIMRVFVDSPEHIAYVLSAIEKLPYDRSQYVLVNGTNAYYDMYAQSLSSVSESANRLLLYTMGGLVAFAFLFSILWNQNESYELSVFLLLGEQRRKVIFEKTLRTSLIALAAYLLAVPVGWCGLSWLLSNAPTFSNVQTSYSSSASFYTGEYNITQTLSLSFSANVLVHLLALAMVLILVFNIRVLRLVLTKHPGELVALTREE